MKRSLNHQFNIPKKKEVVIKVKTANLITISHFFVINILVSLIETVLRKDMSNRKIKLLLVEDDPCIARIYNEYLRHEPYEVINEITGEAALETLNRLEPDVVLLDLHLPDMHGFEVLSKAKELYPFCPVIVITSNGSIDTAVKAMQGGSSDFILKPFNAERLIFTLRHTLERKQLSKIVAIFKKENNRNEYCNFIGKSLPMQEAYKTIDRSANSKASIFITGESGTGKELAAEAIHLQSSRKNKQLVTLNCGAIPKDLIESEIFGHVKGAFTGAVSNRLGAAHQADGGTLFLDEICEMDFSIQVKLLRFLQTNSFRKVGGDKTEKVDVRFVCATNKNPWQEVLAGRFREDLYYRLHVIPLTMPPLAEREGDIDELANFFLNKFASEEGLKFTNFSDQARLMLQGHDWPGNVRELQNVIRQAIVLNDGPIVEASMLMLNAMEPVDLNVKGLRDSLHLMKSNVPAETMQKEDVQLKPLWQAEHDLIQSALGHFDGNVQKAAVALEVSPSTLYRRMRELKETSEASNYQ